jgi:hypothetical protein
MSEEDRLAAIAELLRRADALPGAAPAVALGEHMVEAAREQSRRTASRSRHIASVRAPAV